MEPGKTAAEIALQEAWEEAGLTGILERRPIGSYAYEKAGNNYSVTVFIMHVTDVSQDWPERDLRIRRWLPPVLSAVQVEEPELRKLLQSIKAACGSDAINAG
jgi:8-oxo-dGTP pyrophosphatase MutT (NUDIX family)